MPKNATVQDQHAEMTTSPDPIFREAGAEMDGILLRVMGNANVGITLVNPHMPDNPIVYANKTFLHLSGYKAEDVLGQNLGFMSSDAPDSENERRLSEGFKNAQRFSIERLAYREDGSQYWTNLDTYPLFDDQGQVQYFVVTHVDITFRKRAEFERGKLELELRHAQKLEALGTLAGGIAHEINTPIQYIGDNAAFLRDSFVDLRRLFAIRKEIYNALAAHPDSAALAEKYRMICNEIDIDYLAIEMPRAIKQSMEGVERVSQIVQAIKEFSHPGSKVKQMVDLARAIDSTVTVCRNQWKYVADVETDFDPDLPKIPCLPGEFNQVILNLITNAAHAIEAKNGGFGKKGHIKISTRKVGQWCEIRVSDDGCGIPENLHQKIFDPFFTTKGVGKGTGQGLAISYAIIVNQHGGSIAVQSGKGEGATFTILLPIEADIGDRSGLGRSV